MKGLICAGGLSSRLFPLSLVSSKALLPVFDRPMIYFALSTLMLCQMREILIVVPPADLEKFKHLLGNGDQWNMKIDYVVQPKPTGIASCLKLGSDFIADDSCTVILADNFFCGENFEIKLRNAIMHASFGLATVFGKSVDDPQRFGVVSFDTTGKAVSIEEKPQNPKSSFAVTGLYFYPKGAPALVERLRPSVRGELEITDLNAIYLNEGRLQVELLGRDFTWMDLGTMESLLEGSMFVRDALRSDLHLDTPELVAYQNGWIDRDALAKAIKKLGKSTYGQNLRKGAGF